MKVYWNHPLGVGGAPPRRGYPSHSRVPIWQYRDIDFYILINNILLSLDWENLFIDLQPVSMKELAMIPSKLSKGGGVRVVTPSRSLSMSWITQELQERAQARLEELGLVVSFGKHIREIDEFEASSTKSRVEDLHDAFSDSSVQLIHTVIGGFNSNQLLQYLDYDLIGRNPKILCGFSDITALANAIYAKTRVATYSGPHFFNFGMKHGFEYTLDYFKHSLFSDDPITLQPAKEWSDDRWATKQEEREFIPNDGYWVLNEGEAEGTIIGGNLVYPEPPSRYGVYAKSEKQRSIS